MPLYLLNKIIYLYRLNIRARNKIILNCDVWHCHYKLCEKSCVNSFCYLFVLFIPYYLQAYSFKCMKSKNVANNDSLLLLMDVFIWLWAKRSVNPFCGRGQETSVLISDVSVRWVCSGIFDSRYIPSLCQKVHYRWIERRRTVTRNCHRRVLGFSSANRVLSWPWMRLSLVTSPASTMPP